MISPEVIVNLVASTKTRSGLTVRLEIDTNLYPKGLVVSDIDFDAINLFRDEFHADWSCAIEPPNNEGFVSQRGFTVRLDAAWCVNTRPPTMRA